MDQVYGDRSAIVNNACTFGIFPNVFENGPHLKTMYMRFLTLLIFVFLMSSCVEQKFDMIIRGASVIDGSGSTAFTGDVGVNADTISFIGDLSQAVAAVDIDGAGFTLSPGFIDTHSHHDRGMFEARDMFALTNQGVTTMIVGQDGGSQYPLSEFLAKVDSLPVSSNVGSYTGHNRIRTNALGENFQRQSTPAEIDVMISLLQADLDAGSLGLSTGLEYDPGVYSSKEEVIQLAKVLKPNGGRYISHIRSEDRALWEALDEIVNIGSATGVPVQISHAKLAMKTLWGKSHQMIEKLDSARAAGVDITADIYPYRYWQSSMRAVFFPDRDFKNRTSAEFALSELTTPEGILINNYSPDESYVGKTLTEVASIRGTDPVQTLLDLVEWVEREKGDESIIATSMVEEDIKRIMQWDYTNICSDGNSDGLHPRGHGSFTKILRYYVREENTLSLEEAIHKMTAQAAENLNLRKRGKIAVGFNADLVLFDKDLVADKATSEEPHAQSVGIKVVIVNGVEVMRDGVSTNQFPGKAIRRLK